ncbi:Gti1/Pac2 family-domain-containing protein [Dactylonectria estremocensis]|uniref:Gti1/Pac2 family-domain-containing protein n=1 Tax=Dactylonectria estremocensis TaxID=1079267 RepID=A0A9P9CWM0_9HYPO|nr:Gti1/Pac2 family-domain-containing protein [Dactylonectria estremocensis]
MAAPGGNIGNHGGVVPLNSTSKGFVETALDARELLERCLDGRNMHVPRHPYNHELKSLIKSGSIFIYERSSSGIVKWNDGLPWTEPKPDEEGFLISKLREPDCEPHGLVKKSCTMSYNGIKHSLVSYYIEDDVKNGLLTAISSHEQAVEPREELVILMEVEEDAYDLAVASCGFDLLVIDRQHWNRVLEDPATAREDITWARETLNQLTSRCPTLSQLRSWLYHLANGGEILPWDTPDDYALFDKYELELCNEYAAKVERVDLLYSQLVRGQ